MNQLKSGLPLLIILAISAVQCRLGRNVAGRRVPPMSQVESNVGNVALDQAREIATASAAWRVSTVQRYSHIPNLDIYIWAPGQPIWRLAVCGEHRFLKEFKRLEVHQTVRFRLVERAASATHEPASYLAPIS